MDKASLMRAFKVMCSEAGAAMSDKCKLSAAPLLGLKPLDIREAHIRSQQLGKEICYDGRVIHANICASARVPNSRLLLCLVEADDADSAGAAFLHVFNALASTCTRQDAAQSMFPTDARLAIKEPLCYRSIMHVSSPASLHFLGLAKRLRRRPLEELRREGSRFMAKGSFLMAELYFTECIDVFAARDASTYGPVEKDVFSSRAECRLKLGKFEEAVADADMALSISGDGGIAVRRRSLWSKGRGLSALQEHQLALECLESVMKQGDEEEEQALASEIDRCKVFLRQSQHGDYDLSSYFLPNKASDTPFQCSDYFGPLEIKHTHDGRGRGIFLTRDVQLGDLLLACNPIAAVSSAASHDADEDLVVEIVKACVESERRLKQIYAMADREAAEVTALPDLAPFKCNTGKVAATPRSSRGVDVARIRRARDRVGYSSQGSGGSYVPGLWASVGLINHSCIPNASKMSIGDVVFVRAAKDLKAGDEVLLSYLEPPLAPYAGYREKMIQQYNFECSCERCKLEQSHRHVLGDLPGYEDDRGGSGLAIKVDDDVMDVVVEIEKRIKGMSEQEKDWIRAGFVDHYLAVCMLRDPRVPIDCEQLLRIMRETGSGSKHTLSRIAFLCNISGRKPETMKVLYEQVTALYGRQSPEVVDAITRKYRIPSLNM
ncbi:hypothetical protein SELMODRAFT_419787 [Selaginella moellendorffii]|uniref:SET domain-containing protein n=1 Tax=Selaginella moellendorffii TaxID=88036 RepID=D8SAK0_SELML|nr:hypothetical protein SELMODRAFT_419787 [Selaginella moellendorffii]